MDRQARESETRRLFSDDRPAAIDSMSTSSRGTWQKLLGRHAHESGDSGPPALASASAIRAYLRLRPASAAFQAKRVPQSANIDIVSKHEVVAAPSAFPAADTSSQSLVSSATRSSLSGRAGGSAGDAEIYTFTEVLPEETSQSSLYDTTARPLIENSLGAGPSKSMSDSLILTYGVSGGGKTCVFDDFLFFWDPTETETSYLDKILYRHRYCSRDSSRTRSASANSLRNSEKRGCKTEHCMGQTSSLDRH